MQNFKGDISKCVDVLTNNPEQISQIMEDKSKEYEKTEEARKRMKEDLGNEEGNQYYLIGGKKVALSSEFSNRGRFVANFVLF